MLEIVLFDSWRLAACIMYFRPSIGRPIMIVQYQIVVYNGLYHLFITSAGLESHPRVYLKSYQETIGFIVIADQSIIS